jgi:hypothetical protein
VRTILCEFQGNGLAYTAGCTGYNGYFILDHTVLDLVSLLLLDRKLCGAEVN